MKFIIWVIPQLNLFYIKLVTFFSFHFLTLASHQYFYLNRSQISWSSLIASLVCIQALISPASVSSDQRFFISKLFRDQPLTLYYQIELTLNILPQIGHLIGLFSIFHFLPWSLKTTNLWLGFSSNFQLSLTVFHNFKVYLVNPCFQATFSRYDSMVNFKFN